MTQRFLGIDTGATKSHALIAAADGRVLGFAEGGPGNWETVGWDGTRTVLHDIISRAIAQAGILPHELAGAGFGLAGYDWPEDRPPHVALIRDLLGPDVPFELMNDAFIGLLAGTDAGWGVVVSAGTSCNGYGRNPQGKIGRVTGSSHYGEYAGAGELVWFALQAVAKAWSQRGPQTQLTEAFCQSVGASDAADLLAGLMRDRYAIWAEKAPLVFAVAAQGDPIARELVQWAGHGLGDLSTGIIRQLDIANEVFDVVLSGSFYKGSSLVMDAMAETIHAVAPQAMLVRLDVPPVVGAVLLGMEQVGMDTAVTRPLLIQNATLAQLKKETGIL